MKKHDFRIKNKVMNVDNVRVKETTRGYGIATMMYKFLVKKQNIIFNHTFPLQRFL